MAIGRQQPNYPLALRLYRAMVTTYRKDASMVASPGYEDAIDDAKQKWLAMTPLQQEILFRALRELGVSDPARDDAIRAEERKAMQEAIKLAETSYAEAIDYLRARAPRHEG